MMLCEFASLNHDGTVTIVRGDISNWKTPLPGIMPLYAFAQATPGTFQPGTTYPMEIKVTAPNGAALVESRMELQAPGNSTVPPRVAIGFQLLAREHGTHSVSISLGSLKHAIQVEVSAPEPQGQNP